MVRSTEIQYRTRLLKVIQSGEQPCRRLFLDYHGLRLMWSYMMDLGTNTNEEAQQFRIEVLKTLATLPIPNRTMLIDSRVLDVVEKWSKHLYQPESGESPEDDQSKLKSINEDVEMDIVEKSDLESNKNENDKETESEVKKEIKVEDADLRLISELADNLLAAWSTLKEVFRIPKKERIEQMKEHEREAGTRWLLKFIHNFYMIIKVLIVFMLLQIANTRKMKKQMETRKIVPMISKNILISFIEKFKLWISIN